MYSKVISRYPSINLPLEYLCAGPVFVIAIDPILQIVPFGEHPKTVNCITSGEKMNKNLNELLRLIKS